MRLSKEASEVGFRLVENEGQEAPFIYCFCGGRILPKNETRRRAPLAGDVFQCERCSPPVLLKFSKAKVFSILDMPKPEKPKATKEEFKYVVWKMGPRDAVVIKYNEAGERVPVTDQDGNTLVWTSGGTVGFKGSRKSTPYAAQVAAEQAARRAGEYGMRKVDVIVRGSGSGRETAIRTLQTMGMEVTGIRDITPIPHNGVRLKKRRRG